MDFGSTVIDTIISNNLKGSNVKMFGYDDVFVEHGTINELEVKNKIDTNSLIENIYNFLN